MRSIIKEFELIHIYSGCTCTVKAIGPRDALYSIAGWGALSIQDGWMYSGDWKVKV